LAAPSHRARQLRVDTSSQALREKFSEAATLERRQIRQAVLNTGAQHLRLSTNGDWLRSLVEFLRWQRIAS
jgi:hypothetical protein